MTAALIISLRESFETALIVCVMLGFLQRTHNRSYGRWVWAGLAAGCICSIIFSILLHSFLYNVAEEGRMAMEAGIMILAAALVGWMTMWMAQKSKTFKSDVERSMSTHIQSKRVVGIFFMSFLSTVREGTEMVIMIHASILAGTKVLHAISGILAGIVGASLLGWMFFKGIRKISLSYFFVTTGIILLLLGTGLTVRGTGLMTQHESIAEHHEEGLLEEIFEVLLGTNTVPTPLQAGAGLLYASLVGGLWIQTIRKKA